jgi:hypothetical protein
MTMTATYTTTIPTIVPARSTGRSVARHTRAVRAAFRSEWIKLSTLRTNKLLLALSVGVGAITALALASSATAHPVPASELFIYPLPLVATLALVAGILLFTGEAQHGTLAVTLASRPARWVIVSTKAAMAALVGVAFGASSMLAGFGGAVAGGAKGGDASQITSRALWALLYIALAAMIGLGVGMIVRHSAGAISGLLMWCFVVENLFAPALPQGVLHFLPFSAGYRLLDAGSLLKPPVKFAHELGRPMYALIFAGYALVSLAVGTVLLARQDTN